MSIEAPRTDGLRKLSGMVSDVGEVARELHPGYVLGLDDAMEPDLTDQAVSRL